MPTSHKTYRIELFSVYLLSMDMIIVLEVECP